MQGVQRGALLVLEQGPRFLVPADRAQALGEFQLVDFSDRLPALEGEIARRRFARSCVACAPLLDELERPLRTRLLRLGD